MLSSDTVELLRCVVPATTLRGDVHSVFFMEDLSLLVQVHEAISLGPVP